MPFHDGDPCRSGTALYHHASSDLIAGVQDDAYPFRQTIDDLGIKPVSLAYLDMAKARISGLLNEHRPPLAVAKQCGER